MREFISVGKIRPAGSMCASLQSGIMDLCVLFSAPPLLNPIVSFFSAAFWLMFLLNCYVS